MSASLRRACGQLLTVGFPGHSAPPSLTARIARSEVGGVMLFRPNVAHPEQVADLVSALRDASPPDAPLVVAADQEGGLVQRLRRPLTEWPPMLAVGDGGDPSLTEAVGRALGGELGALGIAWDLAPVLDVNTNPANPVIGGRAFARTPEGVVAHALAFWRGLRSAGLVGCGKHFPGHGDTRLDSHHALPEVPHDRARLDAVELAPFAAAAAAGLEAIMTAHVVFPALDPLWPATMSPAVLTDLLRGRLGFQGLIVSDDLGMKAVADRWPIDEVVVRGLLAGIDCFLIREPEARQQAALEALLHAAETDPTARQRILESAARMQSFKRLPTVGAPLRGDDLRSRIGTPENQALAASFGAPQPDAVGQSPVADG
jgi:beta-N-acetylhexosaminidase